MTRAETLEQESRWALPVAVATLISVALIIGVRFVNSVSGDGDAEVLRSIHENGGSVTATGLMQAVAFALLVFPLVYLFRAARARSPQVRSQLIGLVVVAPLFLALSAGFAIVSQQEAADQFVAGEAKSTLTKSEAHEECVEEDESPLRDCETTKREDDEASNARTEASLTPFATGLGLAGGLGLVVALFYTCLWAMRTGLLSRFWGSLGMALGIATLFGLIIFLMVWLVYFALLVLGKVPNGRPPAWAAGEAVPWPTPGERAAAELEPDDGWDDFEDGPRVEPDDSEDEPPSEPRKRKQRG
ncbi:MAG TPA: hypothetical protein VKB23_08855 [Solirubrobacterales bacterium]|nr:hypothetical protein [Solirubrobacterales bacterium]